MLVTYETVEGMAKVVKGAIRLFYDHLSAYYAFEVLNLGRKGGLQHPSHSTTVMLGH